MKLAHIKLQVGVKILLKNKTGQFLLLRRSAEKYPKTDGVWDIVGGRINIGVDLINNLRREIKEETGLEYQGEPLLIAAQDILRPDKHVVRLTYQGEIEGVPVLNDESSECKWASISEMEQMKDLDVFVAELIQKNLVM
ncbi:MAG TPA: NUDIX domain-containing protein [Candidatus Paceibacterota bacterium]